MRVLVVAAPLLGLVLPLVPLAAALRASGHEVLVAAGDVANRVGALPAHDPAPGFRLDRHALRVLAAHPLVARRELQGTAGHNTELVARRGAGLMDAPLPATITRLLADASLRAAAAEVLAEIAATPDPTDVAAAILAGVSR